MSTTATPGPAPAPCPFCERITAGRIDDREGAAVAFPDGFPISPGHTLVVPVRHVADVFDLEPGELRDLLALVGRTRARLVAERAPDGFNVGVNVGAAAGQTVPHAHLHLIPRYRGDLPDPRGGVRWVLPAKAAYWDAEEPR